MKLIKFFTSIWNWFVGLFKSKCEMEEVVEEGKLVTIVDLDKDPYQELNWSEKFKADRIIKIGVDNTPVPEPRHDYNSKNGVVDMGTIELETEVIVTDADMKALEATGRLEQFEKDYGPKIPISMDAERLVGTPFERLTTLSFETALQEVEKINKPKRRYNKRKPRAGSMTEKPKAATDEQKQIVKEEIQKVVANNKKKRNYYKKKSNV